jgi:RNA polymerase sigma-70 factor (ECF subfamily)
VKLFGFPVVLLAGGGVPLSDEELVRLHLGGDKQAFLQLMERHTRSIYNLAYRLTLDPMEAEDIVQETFLRVHTALPRSRLDLPFRPWLFRIAVNLCRNWAKKRSPVAFTSLEADNEGEETAVTGIPDQAPLPLEQVEEQELQAMLQQAVAALPAAYRLAVTLRYSEGLSYQEMAQVLELPLNTVRTHLFRAKALLRERLGQEAGGKKQEARSRRQEARS